MRHFAGSSPAQKPGTDDSACKLPPELDICMIRSAACSGHAKLLRQAANADSGSYVQEQPRL